MYVKILLWQLRLNVKFMISYVIFRRHQSFLLGPFRLGSGKHTALHGFRILYKMKLLPINIGICWIVLSERPGSSDSEAIRVIFSCHDSFWKKNRFESIVEQILFCVLRRRVHNTYHRVTYYLQFLSDFSIALSLSLAILRSSRNWYRSFLPRRQALALSWVLCSRD